MVSKQINALRVCFHFHKMTQLQLFQVVHINVTALIYSHLQIFFIIFDYIESRLKLSTHNQIEMFFQVS